MQETIIDQTNATSEQCSNNIQSDLMTIDSGN